MKTKEEELPEWKNEGHTNSDILRWGEKKFKQGYAKALNDVKEYMAKHIFDFRWKGMKQEIAKEKKT